MNEDNKKRYGEAKKIILITLVVNIFIFAVKLTALLVSGGKATAAECCHTFADMGMTLAVLISMRFSSENKEKAKTVENRIAKILSAILFLTALGIGAGGLSAIIGGSDTIPGKSAVLAIAVSAALKEAMYRYTLKAALSLSSTALMADAWHHRSDALSSLASLAGVTGARMGLTFLDPIAAITVCILIIKAARDIYNSAVADTEKITT